jgi:hypothetical protein
MIDQKKRGTAMSNESWKNTEQFWAEETYWTPELKITPYINLCYDYHIKGAQSGWCGIDGIVSVPNLACDVVHKNKTDIRHLFSHFYSLINEDGDVYWIVSPDDCDMSKKEIKAALSENYLICDIIEGLRSTYSLVFKPDNVLRACTNYEPRKNDEGTYDLMKINKYMNIEEKIAHFQTFREAEAFAMGFDMAYTQTLAMFAEK